MSRSAPNAKGSSACRRNSDPAIAVAQGGLSHVVVRQMAPRQAAGFRAAQERLRPLSSGCTAATRSTSGTGKDDPSPVIDGERILTDHGYLTELLAEKAIDELQAGAARSHGRCS
jgi:hypothetical protein